jgi:hypothetical protein
LAKLLENVAAGEACALFVVFAERPTLARHRRDEEVDVPRKVARGMVPIREHVRADAKALHHSPPAVVAVLREEAQQVLHEQLLADELVLDAPDECELQAHYGSVVSER